MKIKETELTEEICARLLEMSRVWENEACCRGYVANERSDLEGRKIFVAVEGGAIIGYLFGMVEFSKRASSVMPDGTPCFEIEEIYVASEYRSRGIGAALFTYACDAVKAYAEYAVLSTSSKNWRAILHFYIEELDMEFWSARLFKRLMP